MICTSIDGRDVHVLRFLPSRLLHAILAKHRSHNRYKIWQRCLLAELGECVGRVELLSAVAQMIRLEV